MTSMDGLLALVVAAQAGTQRLSQNAAGFLLPRA
jgi:hypothetical protein